MANSYNVNGQKISADDYNKIKYDSIIIRVQKGQKAVIQAHAVACGESINSFISRAIRETIERDNAKKDGC